MSPLLWLAILSIAISYRIYIIIYNLYFHPLSKIPGPKLYAVSWLPKVWAQQVRGTLYRDLKKMHEKYGPIVRIGPDEVSNASVYAWNYIYGTDPVFYRDLDFFRIVHPAERGTITSPVKVDHSLIRRLLLPAFTDRSVLQNEALIMEWTDKMRQNLQLEEEAGRPVDLCQKLLWTTHDIMGVFALGGDFGCLEKNRQHPSLRAFEIGAAILPILSLILTLPATRFLYGLAVRLPLVRSWYVLKRIAVDRVERETSQKAENEIDEHGSRRDFMSIVARAMHREQKPITSRQAYQLAHVVILAGLETTPTVMAGMLWYILSMPHIYKRLTEEIRAVVVTSRDLKVKNVQPNKLPYLEACFMESLRMHTPFSATIPRRVPEGGVTMEGQFLPGGSIVGVPHWASANLSCHMTDADKFVPERWLPIPPARYAADNLSFFKPFGKGMWECVGKQFVGHEVRMVMATLFWYFDMELQLESFEWVAGANGTVRFMRERKPLYVKLSKARRE